MRLFIVNQEKNKITRILDQETNKIVEKAKQWCDGNLKTLF